MFTIKNNNIITNIVTTPSIKTNKKRFVKNGVVSCVNITVVLSLDELNFSWYTCRGVYSNLVDILVAFMLMKQVRENLERSSIHLMSFLVFPADPVYKEMDCTVGMTVICFRFENK
jgi:hypothetical protein